MQFFASCCILVHSIAAVAGLQTSSVFSGFNGFASFSKPGPSSFLHYPKLSTLDSKKAHSAGEHHFLGKRSTYELSHDGSTALLGNNKDTRLRLGRCLFAAIVIVLLVLPTFVFVMLLLCSSSFRRQAFLWWQVGPIVLCYWRAEWKLNAKCAPKSERKSTFDKLHATFAPQVLQLVLSTKGMFLKAAQMASTRVGIVPLAYRQELAKCTDQCLPMPIKDVKNIVAAALGKQRSIETVFCRFDEEPIGVASVGQVHRARVKASGEDVVVKVKFPEVEKVFAADLQSMKILVRIMRLPQFVSLLEEWSKQVIQEFDYEKEAKNLECMSSFLTPKFGAAIEMPTIVHDLTTSGVLVMSYVEGLRLDYALKDKATAIGLDIHELEKALQPDINDLEVVGSEEATEPVHTASSQEQRMPKRQPLMSRVRDRVLVYMSGFFVDCVLASNRLRDAQKHRFADKQKATPSQILTKIDVKSVIDTLMDVWGYALLQVGTFNGDPHPGNILLQTDGRLGLIDYGQVTTLKLEHRKELARIVLAVLVNDQDATIAAMRRLGIKTAPLPDGTASEWLFAYNALSNVVPSRAHMRDIRDLVRHVPGEMMLVIRTVIILKGVALGLGYRMSVADCWEKWARALLEDDQTASFKAIS